MEKENIDLRFFEIVTMMGFLEFKNQGCEYAVIECGIGGRLDATNIIDNPICSVITSIGLDHMELIGNTLDEIANEKSGIIKKEVPCIIGPTCLSRKPIFDRAEIMNS